MFILKKKNRKGLLAIARVWSVLIVIVYIIIVLGHLFGEEETGSGVWETEDIIAGILLFVVVPAGFAWSWFKNELVGGWLSIAAILGFILIIVAPRDASRMAPVILLIGGPAILYLIAGYAKKS